MSNGHQQVGASSLSSGYWICLCLLRTRANTVVALCVNSQLLIGARRTDIERDSTQRASASVANVRVSFPVR